MAKSKRRYFIKRLFLACLFLAIALVLAVNLILATHKDSITRTFNNTLINPVTVNGIYYLPPNFIVVRNLTISENKSGEGRQILRIPLLYANFSLLRLISERSFYVSLIRCFGPRANYKEFFNFATDNFPKLFDSVRHLPKQNITLSIRGARLYSLRNGLTVSNIKINSLIKLNDNKLLASGKIGKNIYSLKGILMPNGLDIEKFELANGDLHCGLWGWVSPAFTELKGFLFINSLDVNLFMLDIDCRMKFDLPLVQVERLNFSINNNPVKLSGKMFFGKPSSCDFKLSSEFRGMDNKPKSPLKNIDLIASIYSQNDNSLKISSIMKIDFPEKDNIQTPFEKIQLDLKNSNISSKDPTVLNITAKEIAIFCETRSNHYSIHLEDIRAKLNSLSDNSGLLRLSSKFYGGYLGGRSQVVFKGFTPLITASFNIKEADADKMGGVSDYLPKASGKLSSWIYFNNYPQPAFRGNLLISDGALNNVNFFKWLADTFNLPSLKKLNFHLLSSELTTNNSGFNLKNMRLDSKDIKLKGDFKISDNDLVSSKISLSFATAMLQGSSKFTPLLNLLDKKPEFLDFNFQLSGNLHKMNFQWLRSDFKDELQKKIPNFIKRRLEKNVESMFNSIPEE